MAVEYFFFLFILFLLNKEIKIFLGKNVCSGQKKDFSNYYEMKFLYIFICCCRKFIKKKENALRVLQLNCILSENINYEKMSISHDTN